MSWVSPQPSFYTESELLAVAFLVKKSGYFKAEELRTWASVAMTEADRVKQLGPNWTEPDRAEWQGLRTNIPEMYRPLWNALTQTEWPTADQEQIGVAMKVRCRRPAVHSAHHR